MKHYRFYTTRSKRQTTQWARAVELADLKQNLASHLGLKLQDQIIVHVRDGSLMETRDGIEQMLGRAGIFCYYSWDYPHLATENPDAINYIEAHLPSWAKILKKPSKVITGHMTARNYEKYHYGS